MRLDLERFNHLSRATLIAVEQFLSLDTCPIYAILHEPLYCYKNGIASGWAAEKVGKELDGFSWLSNTTPPEDMALQRLFFSGEMMFPFMFDTFPELIPLKEVAGHPRPVRRLGRPLR